MTNKQALQHLFAGWNIKPALFSYSAYNAVELKLLRFLTP